ncbi:uncharacterized protein LOC142334629 isoform X1 [Convolutriloba macropyga]|uniref:uncharacterized protein LOC142334629 isoform X1 n=1 Tax=Convolutriloba macropyga TaxID=536237 RepID=UPI003F5261B8
MEDHGMDDESDAEVQAYMGSLGGQGDNEPESMSLDELAEYLRSNPLSLMAQNVASEVFDSVDCKGQFEECFRSFCQDDPEQVSFNYLKSFRRVRVNFPIGFNAICAKIELHQSVICGSLTNVYLADQPLPNVSDSEFLSVPKSDKMFLISPPPSPPVGWEACYEDPPHPAPDLDLSAMNISSSPSNRRVTARNIQGVPSGIGSNPIAGTMRSSDEGQDARFQDNMSAAVGPGSSSNPTLDTMLLLTAFAHHCSQPGQVVEILPEDDGNPSIMVTSVDGPAMKDEGEVRHRGPIPRSPCPPFAVWTGDDNDAEGEQDDIPVYSDSDWEEEKDNNTRSHQGSLDPRASPELFNGHA